MSDPHAAEQSAEEKPKKGKKKLMFIVLGVVGLLGGAGVPVFMMMGGEPKKEEAVEEAPHEEVKRIETADLGQFIVNLSESSSFLKVRIMIEYDAAVVDKQAAPLHGEEGGKAHGGGASGGEAKEGEGGGMHPIIASNENKLRDRVISILSGKRADELLTTDGKARLKEELVDGLNEAIGLEEPPVVGVLFTEFIIQ